MKTLLARLDTWLRRERPDLAAAMSDGAGDDDIEEANAELGFELPNDLEQLLRWCNGTEDADGAFFYNRELMAAAGVAEAKAMLDEMLEAGEFDEPGWWSPAWLPFLDNGGGDHHVVDVGGAFGGQPGQILEFWHDDDARVVIAPSLEAWLGVFVASLEQGMWHEEDDGNFSPQDDGDYEALCRRLLPGYPKRFSAKNPL